MLKLLKHAKILLTDSGGLQKEGCITIRDGTEWSETVEMGVNTLTSADPNRIIQAIKYVEEKHSEINDRFKDNAFGDGKTSGKKSKSLESTPRYKKEHAFQNVKY